MKKLRIVEVVFDTEIKAEELPGFRGAIIEKVGKENILFHNHLGDSYRFAYPLIQYKRIKNNPAILCLDDGVDEIYKVFEKSNWSINLYGRLIDLKIKTLKLHQFNLNVYDTYFYYDIANWIGLNDTNYKEYKQLETEEQKLEMLERILVGNIMSFAKGIKWIIESDKKVVCKILSINKEKTNKFKEVKKKVFNLSLKTNVFLPQHIGLGKASSMGYGIVFKKMKVNENE